MGVSKKIISEVAEKALEKGKKLKPKKEWVVKTIPKENRDLMEHVFPWRFTAFGVGAVGVATAAYGIGTTALNEQKARQIGRIEATPVANTIGRPSMGHDAQIVRDIPNQTKTHGVNKFIDAIPGVQGKRYDDMGAGGDLVLAMHE
ncbi:MAG: hypothetical protein IJ085_01455, partial [Turicibacter sp.]|nr:hypothetical protein [Turicibacter sp.]